MEKITTSQYPGLRRQTQRIAEEQNKTLAQILTDMKPMLRHGDPVRELIGAETAIASGKAAADFMVICRKLISAKPFTPFADLRVPEMVTWQLDLQPFQYSHTVAAQDGNRSVTVITPLKSVVTFAGYGLDHLRVMVAQRDPPREALQRYLSHAVLLAIVMRQSNVKRIIEGLHYELANTTMEEFGNLPLIVIGSSIPTARPSDDVIVEITELSGINQIEEVVDCEAARNLRDPFRERLEDLLGTAGDSR